jgi:hypothetical protein
MPQKKMTKKATSTTSGKKGMNKSSRKSVPKKKK